jgi:hypothetical protein
MNYGSFADFFFVVNFVTLNWFSVEASVTFRPDRETACVFSPFNNVKVIVQAIVIAVEHGFLVHQNHLLGVGTAALKTATCFARVSGGSSDCITIGSLLL